MIRYWYVIIRNIFWILHYIGVEERMKLNPSAHNEEDRYKIALKVINILKRTGYVETSVYGEERLPEEGGYVMFANHQGKYDALGIMYGHKKPCTFVMDEKRSHLPIVKEFVDLLYAKRLKKDNVKQAMKIIYEVAEEVKQGRKYIIFPSGGYENKGNEVIPFKAGSFKAAVKAKAPVVPVAIIDSYKVFESNERGRVRTQVHFLSPICYDEYKNMKTVELAKLVESQIADCIRTYAL